MGQNFGLTSVYFQDYAAMGPSQREHMHALSFLRGTLAALENVDDRSKTNEITQLVGGMISLLVRRYRLCKHNSNTVLI